MLRDFKTTYSTKDDILNNLFKKAIKKSNVLQFCSAYFSNEVFKLLYDELNDFCDNGGVFELIIGEKTDASEIKDLILYFNNHETSEEKVVEFIYSQLISSKKLNIETVVLIYKMIKNNQLKIKIGFNNKFNSIFHNKFYIFENSNFNIAATGSANFTVSGLTSNYESLVLRESLNSFNETKAEFDSLWNDCYDGTTIKTINQMLLEKIKSKHSEVVFDENASKFEVREYQQEAIDLMCANEYIGLLKMATGSGKTFTSCMIIKEMIKNKLCNEFLIVVPYIHLVAQWESEIKKFVASDFEINIIQCHSYSKDWRQILTRKKYYPNKGEKIDILIFVNDSFKKYDCSMFYEKAIFCDELHNMKSSINEIEKFKYRIGLSATLFDEDDETIENIFVELFENNVFEYTLKEAIDNNYLVNYNYYPIFVELENSEVAEYKQLKRLYALTHELKYKKDIDELISNAEKKTIEFKNIFAKHYNLNAIKNCIVYCSSGESKITKISNIIATEAYIKQVDKNITLNKITCNESNSQRSEIIKSFKMGSVEVICAIKCLDEGVDIPEIKNAYILNSTRKSKEHIQRRGRILRKSKGKEFSNIYDFVMMENGMILKNEYYRVKEYMSLSLNIDETKREIEKYEIEQ